MKPVPLWIVGGSGVLAGETARLALNHPGLELRALISREVLDLKLHQPHLSPTPRSLDRPTGFAEIRDALASGETVAVVTALPHGASAAAYDELLSEIGEHEDRLVFVDLASDFRLQDAELHEATYPDQAHPARDDFHYGLPEFADESLTDTRRVAAPGCFATALQLATIPAAKANLLREDIPWVYFGVTGSSGSGASPKPGTHHPHRDGNMWAYSVGGHRHEAELKQAAARLDLQPNVHFIAHSGPFVRGIHMTATLPLNEGVQESDARTAFGEAYADTPFVDLVTDRPPALRSIVGSNRSEVSVHVREDVLTVLVTLDNLGKGGSGQGLQALNLMLGYPETLGVPLTGAGV